MCLFVDNLLGFEHFVASRTVGTFGKTCLGTSRFNSSIGDRCMVGFHDLVAFGFRPLRGGRIAGGVEGHVGGALAECAVIDADLAVFNGDIHQTVALAKCAPVDFRYPDGEDDGPQMSTAFK